MTMFSAAASPPLIKKTATENHYPFMSLIIVEHLLILSLQWDSDSSYLQENYIIMLWKSCSRNLFVQMQNSEISNMFSFFFVWLLWLDYYQLWLVIYLGFNDREQMVQQVNGKL